METKFSDNGITGTYKENYQGKYFYHISNKTNFSELNRNNLIPVTRDMDIYRDGDLIDNDNIKQYVKEN